MVDPATRIRCRSQRGAAPEVPLPGEPPEMKAVIRWRPRRRVGETRRGTPPFRFEAHKFGCEPGVLHFGFVDLLLRTAPLGVAVLRDAGDVMLAFAQYYQADQADPHDRELASGRACSAN